MATGFDPDTARIDIGTLMGAVWRRKWRILLVTATLLALTYVVLLFLPRIYESSASILVEPRDSAFLRVGNDTGSSVGAVSDEMAIASQVELVQSRDTLLSVIETENLASVPELNEPSSGIAGVVMALLGHPPKQLDINEIVLNNVAKRLKVGQESDSRVISVSFSSESPVLASRVANAIAQAHVSRRAGLVVSDTADASKWLETEIDKLRQKVAEADAKVANFRIENDLYAGTDGNSSLIDQQLSDIAAQITQSQERQSTAKSRAEVLKGLIRAGKPIDSVPAVQDSTVINGLATQKSELQSKKAELLARLLPNHPSVVTLNAQISEINSQIMSEGRRIADSLEAEAEIEAQIEASLREEMARLKLNASSDLTNGVTLAELEREAKAQRDLLETYLVRYRDASSRTDASSALPDVRVVTAAAPSIEPAFPKTTLILFAVLVVTLAGQIGLILFSELVSGLAIIDDAVSVAGGRATRREPEAEDESLDEPVAAKVSSVREKPVSASLDLPQSIVETVIVSTPEPIEVQEALPAADAEAVADPLATEPVSDAPDTDAATRFYEDEGDAAFAEDVMLADEDAMLAEEARLAADLVSDPSYETVAETLAAAPAETPVRPEPPKMPSDLRDALKIAAEPAVVAETVQEARAPLAGDSSQEGASAAMAELQDAAREALRDMPEAAPAEAPKPASRPAAAYADYVPRGTAQAKRPRRAESLPRRLRPLVDAIASGKEHRIMIASVGDPAYANSIVEQLGAACGTLGLGVATIDAASGRPSANAGLGDLLIGGASFGDVVHADRGGYLARVPWGRQAKLDSHSSHGVTLAEALSDIYHVVLIAVGQPGAGSSLPVFAGLEAYLLIACAEPMEEDRLSGIAEGAEAMGFARVQVISPGDEDVQVA